MLSKLQLTLRILMLLGWPHISSTNIHSKKLRMTNNHTILVLLCGTDSMICLIYQLIGALSFTKCLQYGAAYQDLKLILKARFTTMAIPIHLREMFIRRKCIIKIAPELKTWSYATVIALMLYFHGQDTYSINYSDKENNPVNLNRSDFYIGGANCLGRSVTTRRYHASIDVTHSTGELDRDQHYLISSNS